MGFLAYIGGGLNYAWGLTGSCPYRPIMLGTQPRPGTDRVVLWAGPISLALLAIYSMDVWFDLMQAHMGFGHVDLCLAAAHPSMLVQLHAYAYACI